MPTQNGLIFPSNGVAGGDIGIDWTSTAMLPRFSHTAIWKANYVAQADYYAVAWHCLASNSWGSGASGWEFGTHPYPTNGNFDGSGHTLGGTGTTHYYEIANGFDLICDGTNPGLVVTKAIWVTQARTCKQVGSDYVHTFYPDIDNNPSFAIVWTYPVASVTADPGTKFRIGTSPWAGDGSQSPETPSGTFRHFLQYDRALTFSEIQTKAALAADDTTDPNVWYSNLNPTPSDVTDKSGKGHNPTWANANRPTLYAWVMAPTISTQPSNTTVYENSAASFTVAATTSGGSLSYQWQDNRSGSFANVIDGSGGTSPAYTTPALAQAASGRLYQCVVTDSNGSTTTNSAKVAVFWLQGNPVVRRSKPSGASLFQFDWFGPDLTIEKWFDRDMPAATGGGGGGSTYNVSISESLSASDAWTAVLTAVNSLSAAGTAADTVSATGSFGTSLSEAGTAADALVANWVGLRSLTEAASASDAWANLLTALNSLSESLTAADALASTWSGTAVLTEAGAANDSVSAGATTYNVSLTEAASAVDALATVATFGKTLTEAATAADALTGALTAAAALTEAGSAAAAQTAIEVAVASLSEALAANDSVAAGAATYTVTLSEAVTAADSELAQRVMAGSVSEAANAADALAVVQLLGAILNEVGNAQDGLANSLTTLASLLEAANAADLVEVILPVTAGDPRFVIRIGDRTFNIRLVGRRFSVQAVSRNFTVRLE